MEEKDLFTSRQSRITFKGTWLGKNKTAASNFLRLGIILHALRQFEALDTYWGNNKVN